MMLLRSDDTGDLYSFVGSYDKVHTVILGYNDANVNYAYGVDVGSIVNTGEYSREYDFDIKERNINKIDTYNRGVYFPITDDSFAATGAAAKETILNTNRDGYDRKDYKLFLNNCDQNARRWI